jgi:hypothetical protein
MSVLTNGVIAGLFTVALSSAAFSHSTGHSGGQGGTVHGGNGPSSHASSKSTGHEQGCYGMNHRCGTGPHLHGGPKGTSFPHQLQ